MFKPKPSQEKVYNALLSWLTDASSSHINLSGFAGCGKTSMLAGLATEALSRNISVTVIAPTHAALQELAARLPETCVYKTVSAATGQAPNVQNNKVDISFIYRSAKPLSGLVILDESSMLGELDIKILLQLLEPGAKFIASGDVNQLKPVKKKSGYHLLENQEKFMQLQLTECIRSNETIFNVGQKAKNVVQYIPETSSDNSVINHGTEEQLLESFVREVKSHDPGECVWITRTNAEVHEVNRKAFSACYPEATSQLFAGLVVRLGQSSLLGKNNTLAKLSEVSLSSRNTYIVKVAPDSPAVEVALPEQYVAIERQIESLVQQFQNNAGSELLATELSGIRAIVPIDYCYSMTTHKSQGKSIRVVYANSAKLFGKSAFFVAYTRASEQLNVCNKVGKSHNTSLDEHSYWVYKTGEVLSLVGYEAGNASAVYQAIAEEYPELPLPSVSHLSCCLNPSHASKSAKGWKLAR